MYVDDFALPVSNDEAEPMGAGWPPATCQNPGPDSAFTLPLKNHYLAQIFDQFGLNM